MGEPLSDQLSRAWPRPPLPQSTLGKAANGAANGHANGVNGHANGYANGHANGVH
jgi:hypothetical protein